MSCPTRDWRRSPGHRPHHDYGDRRGIRGAYRRWRLDGPAIVRVGRVAGLDGLPAAEGATAVIACGTVSRVPWSQKSGVSFPSLAVPRLCCWGAALNDAFTKTAQTWPKVGQPDGHQAVTAPLLEPHESRRGTTPTFFWPFTGWSPSGHHLPQDKDGYYEPS
jgi:hypothetical protein